MSWTHTDSQFEQTAQAVMLKKPALWTASDLVSFVAYSLSVVGDLQAEPTVSEDHLQTVDVLKPFFCQNDADLAAASNAYTPYSHFAVGAALLADDGRIFTGANVENASFGLTICAERAALFAAVNTGVHRFRALAVVAGARTPAAPCGACRQVLAEFCDNRMPVFCGARTGAKVRRTTLGALLPLGFRLKVVDCRL